MHVSECLWRLSVDWPNLPSVEDVLEGDGKDIGLLGASKVGNMGIEGDALLSSTGLGNGQADSEDGVGAKLGLVGGSVEVDQELVDLGLVLDVDALLDDRGSDDIVDVGNSLENTLASPLGLVTVAELTSLVLTCWSRC